MLIKNYASNHKKFGFTLVEAMVGVVIFCLMFTYIFKAFAPVATDSHNLLRGTTIAMNACSWYINILEQRIQYDGALSASDLGIRDITSEFGTENFSDIELLRSLKVTSDIKLEDNLYNIKISFDWGNSDNKIERMHHFEMSRLIVQPVI